MAVEYCLLRARCQASRETTTDDHYDQYDRSLEAVRGDIFVPGSSTGANSAWHLHRLSRTAFPPALLLKRRRKLTVIFARPILYHSGNTAYVKRRSVRAPEPLLPTSARIRRIISTMCHLPGYSIQLCARANSMPAQAAFYS